VPAAFDLVAKLASWPLIGVGEIGVVANEECGGQGARPERSSGGQAVEDDAAGLEAPISLFVLRRRE